MKNFNVTCTMTYNGSIDVVAENENDAIQKVQELIYNEDNNVPYSFSIGGISFELGEITSDYADEF